MDPLRSALSFNPLRKASPLVGRQPALDGYTPSLQGPGIYAKQEALTSAVPARSDLVRKVAASFFLASATAAALSGVPQVALAQEPTAAALSKEQLKTQGLSLLTKSKIAQGQSIPLQEGLQRLKPEARQRLQGLPIDVQQVFVNLEPEAMNWMLERVNATTWVAIIPINNRDALISGSAMGVDVYDRAVAGLKKEVARGTIAPEMEGRLGDLLQRLKSLTPEQRGTLVRALEGQQG